MTLVDRRNHHLFQPLLYQVATAGLAAPDIASPIRQLLHAAPNVKVLLAEAVRVEPDARRLVLDSGALDYDHLVLAAGAVNSWFGRDAEWAPHAPGLKTLEDAMEIRRRVLCAFEAAERLTDPDARRPWLTFVVIGGGPTGVEIAGAISEIARTTMARDFRGFDSREVQVHLVEGGERLLAGFHPESSARAARDLERIGVRVVLGERVTDIDEAGVSVGDTRIEARTVVWGAGVRGAPIAESLGVELARGGRVPVEADLSVPGRPEIFVVGDLAAARWIGRSDDASADGGREVPGMAQGAIQGGRHAAEQILRRIAGRDSEPFRYIDKGSMATIGRRRAVAELAGTRFGGIVAWILWLVVHLMALVGFRNRLVVFVDWAWLYVTYQRSARIILAEGPPGRSAEEER